MSIPLICFTVYDYSSTEPFYVDIDQKTIEHWIIPEGIPSRFPVLTKASLGTLESVILAILKRSSYSFRADFLLYETWLDENLSIATLRSTVSPKVGTVTNRIEVFVNKQSLRH